MVKRAIILFNLGGPDATISIEPFLFNLFKDPAIINLPNVFRIPLAKIISKRRAKVAEKIYAHLGGKSPLLKLTLKQAVELEISLTEYFAQDEVRVFPCMRYWHPMSSRIVLEVKAFDPNEILLLPLYPQFSTTTTGSSFADWKKTALKFGLQKPTYSICCYPKNKKWARAQGDLLMKMLSSIPNKNNVRVLFSAHGLPQKIVDRGDPYQWQVEQSAQAIAETAKIPNKNWEVCYQRRVGPMEWLRPSLDFELQQATKDKTGVVVVPIACVSEHSETLVELDIEYKKIADDLGLQPYRRVPAIGTHQYFIDGLKDLVVNAFEQKVPIGPLGEKRNCPARFNQCPCPKFN